MERHKKHIEGDSKSRLTSFCVNAPQYEYACLQQAANHLGSSSFITNTTGYASQPPIAIGVQCLPFGEPKRLLAQSSRIPLKIISADEQTFVDQQNGYDSRYTFSAKEKDDETQYSYFGARYYDSDLSVWLSVDPLSDKYPNLSPYAYCANNPVMLIDPDGRETILNEGQFNFNQVIAEVKNTTYHTSYSKQDYIGFFEKSHNVTMSPKQHEYLDAGCIGITSIEIYNEKNLAGFTIYKGEDGKNKFVPGMSHAYGTLEQAVSVMNTANRIAKSFGIKGRFFVFGIRYYTSDETKGIADKKGKVDMSFWLPPKGILNEDGSSQVPFDYGLYNENTGYFWHADWAADENGNMTIYESDQNHFESEYPGSFNRVVYVIGFSKYKETVSKH